MLEPKLAERWPFNATDKVKLGTWMFLFGEVILFGSLIGSYVFVRIQSTSWPAAGELHNITIGAANTFILLTSSMFAVLALTAAKENKQGLMKTSLLLTFLLGLIFLVNKSLEWNELFNHGFTFSSGLPATTFYLTTGVHGAHVLAGMLVLLYIIVKAFKGMYGKDNHATIEYFGLYWHFVDIVWVFLFPLFYLI